MAAKREQQQEPTGKQKRRNHFFHDTPLVSVLSYPAEDL
jgi:hypothetical protein